MELLMDDLNLLNSDKEEYEQNYMPNQAPGILYWDCLWVMSNWEWWNAVCLRNGSKSHFPKWAVFKLKQSHSG